MWTNLCPSDAGSRRGECRPRSLRSQSIVNDTESAGETNTIRKQSKGQSSSAHGHAAGGLRPRPRPRGCTQDAECWGGWHSPATRPVAPVRDQGTSTGVGRSDTPHWELRAPGGAGLENLACGAWDVLTCGACA